MATSSDVPTSGRTRGSSLRLVELAGAAVLKCVAVGLRIGADDPAEMLAEVGCSAEAALLCNGLDRQVTDFKESLSELDTLKEKPLVWGGSGSGQESPGKRSRTHRRPDRKILDGHLFIEMLL